MNDRVKKVLQEIREPIEQALSRIQVRETEGRLLDKARPVSTKTRDMAIIEHEDGAIDLIDPDVTFGGMKIGDAVGQTIVERDTFGRIVRVTWERR